MKTCFRCLAVKPLSDFYKHPMMADGHLGKCAECTKADVAANRIKRREAYRAYDAARDVGVRREKREAASRAWSLSNPDKRKVHRVTRRAKASGKIPTKTACEFCKNSESKIEMHHDDYSKPLEVRWLCVGCHRSWHSHLAGKTAWRLIHLGVLPKPGPFSF